MPFYGIADKGQVSNDIQQLMTRRLIGETQLEVVEIALALDLDLVPFEGLGQTGHFLIGHGLVYHYDGVVDIPALDKIVFQQHLQLMEKTKSATGTYLGLELPHGLKT